MKLPLVFLAASFFAAPLQGQSGDALLLRLPAGLAGRNGVRWTTLHVVTRRKQSQALATVLSAEPLIAAKARLAAIGAKLGQDAATVNYAKSEAGRLQHLYAQNQNVSLKAVQAAQLAWHNDKLQMKADAEARGLILADTAQAWGRTVTRWLATGAPSPMTDIFDQRSALVEVSPPWGTRSPRRVGLTLPGPAAARIEARFVSRFPRVDPRAQTPGYLYIAPVSGVLAPGLNLTASVGRGRARAGVLVPASAVLYWNGGEWIFIRQAAGKYRLQPLSGARARAGGAFVPGRTLAGRQIVVAGAQQLLTEYQKQGSAGAAGGAGGDADD